MTEDAKYAAVQVMGLIDMHRLRNGRSSAENEHSDRLIRVIEKFFGVNRANVNDILLTDDEFSEFFGI